MRSLALYSLMEPQEWNVYCCVASLVCLTELHAVLKHCELPKNTASRAADCEHYGEMMRCLYKQGLFLRWDGQSSLKEVTIFRDAEEIAAAFDEGL